MKSLDKCLFVDVVDAFGVLTRNVRVTPHVYRLYQKDKKEACVQRTQEWFDKRSNHITASSVASIIGQSHFGETRTSVLRKKLRVADDTAGPWTVATDWGVKYEPIAIRAYENLTKKKVIPLGLLESINPGEEHLAGSPDGITQDEILVEVKCPYRRTPTDKVPDYYLPQIQFLMAILQVDQCDFVQYVPGTPPWTDEVLIVTRVPRDPEWMIMARPLLDAFWNDVQRLKGVPMDLLTLPNDDSRLDDALRTKPKRVYNRVKNNSSDKEEFIMLDGPGLFEYEETHHNSPKFDLFESWIKDV